LAAFSFAASNFSRQRVEARQPKCPEPVEPVVDFAKPAGLHSVDRAKIDTASIASFNRRRLDSSTALKAMGFPDLDIYRAVRPGILDGIVICAGGE
jgi:hypothetical protein